MNTETIMISLQLLVITLVIMALLTNWRKIKQNGGNGTLSKISGQMDAIKLKYQTENDLLLANLNVISGKDYQRNADKRDAIIDFFSRFNEWIWDGLNISVHEYNHTNYQELTTLLVSMKEHYNRTNVAFGRLQLILRDEKLLNIGYEAVMESLKLHHYVENTIKSYLHTLSWEKTLLDKITSKDYDFFQLSPDMKSFYEKQARENDAEKKRILDGYDDRHWALFNPVIQKRNEFRDIAREDILDPKNENSNGLAKERWNSL